MNMHDRNIASVFQELHSLPEGLTDDLATARLTKFGANELPATKKVPLLLKYLRQFKDFMILILIAAAVLSGLMGDFTDMVIILVIVAINATVGFIQEFRAEKTLEALKKMTVTMALVKRHGNPTQLSSTQLVPGDVVILEAGVIIPADIRLFETHNLQVDESSLTGESVSVQKNGKVVLEAGTPLAERINTVFKGTQVSKGRGLGVVFATGKNTEIGKIASLLQEKDQATPLQLRMARFGKVLSYLILLICLIIFIAGILRGEDPFHILLLSISLAVAAIPEALPALITIALARGAGRLARRNALVRKLPAVETLGSVSFICSDKTGTLTQNKMSVVDTYVHSGSDSVLPLSGLHLGMLLNHDVSWNKTGEIMGDPTEIALVSWIIQDLGMQKINALKELFPRVKEIPFDSERKCMSTIHPLGDRFLVITKGATEFVSRHLIESGEAVLAQKIADQWAAQGKRVLTYAYRILPELPEEISPQNIESDLILAGLTALVDPPRPEVKPAIIECRTAGIKPVMITGDHPSTAQFIAHEIGLMRKGDRVLTGSEMNQLDDETFAKDVTQVAVYARVTPDQKLRIVKTLQQKSHFVAMTGDGVNDAPSLKAANIGVAMGITGTDVSKEAAHLILLDDNFATIISAVREGRRIFDNIRKFVKYIMTCNGAEIWTIFLAPLLGMPLPLLPIHILWINLVTDGFPALALANEKPEEDIMKRPPRPASESLFSDGVGYHILWVGLLMAGVTLGTQAWASYHRLEHWQTMVFSVLALSQLGHVLAVRSDHTFFYRQGIFSNLPLLV